MESHAEDLTAVVDSTGYFINLTSNSTSTGSGSGTNPGVVWDILGTTEGTVAVASDNINIKSNAPNGYGLYVSMEGSTSNRLYQNGDATSGNYIVPTSGTFAAPAALDMNAWGFSLANNGTFAAMPLKGNDQLIQTVDTPDAVSGIDTPIYYGVKANTTLPSGTYKGAVTYTAIARSSVSNQDTASVSPSFTTKLGGAEQITIATNLMINPDTIELDETTGTNITTDGTDLSVIVEVGGDDCEQKQFARASDDSLKITCLAPAKSTGRYDVYIRIPKYSKVYTIVNGITYGYSEQDKQAAVDEAVNDTIGTVTGGDATPNDILSGKTAYINGTSVTGTMVNNGAVTPATLNFGASYTIPAGFHNGSGKVTAAGCPAAAANTTAGAAAQVLAGYSVNSKSTCTNITGTMTNRGAISQTINPGGSYTIPAGYHNGSGKVTANANQNSGTYTFPANHTGTTVDMGVNNTYRYVNAANVYAKGKADGVSANVTTIQNSARQGTGTTMTFSVTVGKTYLCAEHGWFHPHASGTSGTVGWAGATTLASWVYGTNANVSAFTVFILRATSTTISAYVGGENHGICFQLD